MIVNSVLGTVVYQGKLLLINRAKPPYQGKWALVGGKIEYGEHPNQTIVREFKEETNLDVTIEALKGIASEILVDITEKPQGHFLMYIYRLTCTTHEVQESDEGKLQWVPIGDLEAMQDDMIPSDFLMIKEFILTDRKIDFHKIVIMQKGQKYYLEEFGA